MFKENIGVSLSVVFSYHLGTISDKTSIQFAVAARH